MNLYSYVGNDPVNYVDPLGLERVESGLIYDDSGRLIGEVGLEQPLFDPIDLIPIGTAIAKTPKTAKACGYAINHNRYLRLGFGRRGGDRVFRASGELIRKFNKRFRGIDNSHIDFWNGGPL